MGYFIYLACFGCYFLSAITLSYTYYSSTGGSGISGLIPARLLYSYRYNCIFSYVVIFYSTGGVIVYYFGEISSSYYYISFC